MEAGERLQVNRARLEQAAEVHKWNRQAGARTDHARRTLFAQNAKREKQVAGEVEVVAVGWTETIIGSFTLQETLGIHLTESDPHPVELRPHRLLEHVQFEKMSTGRAYQQDLRFGRLAACFHELSGCRAEIHR